MERIFFDVTFTSTQGAPTGVTRTARRLLEELGAVAPERATVEPIVYHSSGFRHLPLLAAPAATAAANDRNVLAALGAWLSPRLPMPLRLVAWRAYHALLFNRAAAGRPAVSWRTGDLALLFDASWNYQVWRAARKARMQGAQVVLLVYDLMPLREPKFSSRLFSRVFARWLRLMLPEADAVLCISGAVEKDLRCYAAEESIALGPTSHFRLGSDPAKTPRGVCRPTLRYFLEDPQAPCFAAVGSFEPKKNYGFLLGAFENLWSSGSNVRLVILGRDAGECPDLVAYVRAHAEQGRRLLTIFDASDAEVSLVYAKSRALVFPSLMEGFGLPLVEARTAGCPVIASDLPVFLELADDGVFIYARDSQGALEALVASHAAQDRRHVAAMQPFLWRDSARQCLECATALLAQPRSVTAGDAQRESARKSPAH